MASSVKSLGDRPSFYSDSDVEITTAYRLSKQRLKAL